MRTFRVICLIYGLAGFSVPALADQTDSRLNELFAQLREVSAPVEAAPIESQSEGGSAGFPRAGAWAPIPSVSIEALSIEDPPLSAGFELAAAALRHQVADPLLPPDLVPADWPGPSLRTAYRRYNQAYRTELSAFFRSRSRVTG